MLHPYRAGKQMAWVTMRIKPQRGGILIAYQAQRQISSVGA
jgi:hypothetical protein